MRQSLACPKCSGRKFYEVDPPRTAGTQRMTIAAEAFPFGTRSANVAAFVCATCGYTEWYAACDDLKQMAEMGATSIRVVDASGTKGAYR